ncbi:helix-turn-helix domain-containing protein, partial [Streptomyces bambusae]
MGRQEQPLDPRQGPLARFAYDLRELRRRAGSPSYRELATRTHYSASTLAAAASGRRLPSAAVLAAFVGACGGDPEEWEQRRLDTHNLVTGPPLPPQPLDPAAGETPAVPAAATSGPAGATADGPAVDGPAAVGPGTGEVGPVGPGPGGGAADGAGPGRPVPNGPAEHRPAEQRAAGAPAAGVGGGAGSYTLIPRHR